MKHLILLLLITSTAAAQPIDTATVSNAEKLMGISFTDARDS